MIVLAVMLAWTIGSLPASTAVERFWKTDLRSVGSGNVGAGNATRSLGLAAGAVLAVLDGLKGLVPVVAAGRAGFTDPSVVAIGLAAVAGNNWPIWRRGRGGRGLATSVGVLVGFAPGMMLWPTLWAVIGWRIGGGLAGFLGWGGLPFYTWLSGWSTVPLLLTVGLATMMIVRRAQGNAGDMAEGRFRRILFDRDSRPVVAPSRPLAVGRGRVAWVPALVVVGFPMYVWLAGTRAVDVSLGVGTVILLLMATGTELGAKVAFGALFAQGTAAAGTPVPLWSGFRAALIGTGVARLIPAGGLITPVAMAWAVRDESEQAAGAAVRATVLSYGGMAGLTGLGLMWVGILHPPGRGAVTSVIVGSILVAVAAVLIGVGGRLRRLVGFVPRRFRSRVEALTVDHALDARAWGLLTVRSVLEAATLGFTLIAFGIEMLPSQVVAAFGVSQLVGGLPGTPGGLGVTEAGLVGVLALFGIPAAAAATPVLTFRLISYWIPALGGLAAGGHAYLRRLSR